MKRSFKFVAAMAAFVLFTVSCGVVSFTGRQQMLLFSDSEIAALSEESYNEFMKSAAPEFWEKMMEGKNRNSNDFFSTHPSDAKRVEALKQAIKTNYLLYLLA